jgi:hypothetical protein
LILFVPGPGGYSRGVRGRPAVRTRKARLLTNANIQGTPVTGATHNALSALLRSTLLHIHSLLTRERSEKGKARENERRKVIGLKGYAPGRLDCQTPSERLG